MKRKLFTLAALMSATLGLNAQQTLEVYSAYDVNQDTKVQVEDVTTVVNATFANSTIEDKTVVDAAKLNALLLDIYQKLEKLDKLEAEHAEIMAKLEYITTNTLDENGIRANGHEYVDLGLTDEQGHTIYWATCNVGADKPEDAGQYFAWGETVGYESSPQGTVNDFGGVEILDGRSFHFSIYKWCNGSYDSMTKYCANSSNGKVDNKKVLEPEDDAAHVNWGGDWRMPTFAELDQLKTKCTWTWDSTKNGHIVKGPNDNSIFLPAAGYRSGTGLYYTNCGYYWSSSLIPVNSYNAHDLGFGSIPFWESGARSSGRSVRAVCVSIE